MRRRNTSLRRLRGFSLLELTITLTVLAVVAVLLSRLTQATFATFERTRSDDRSNAALDRALMLMRRDAWSARTLAQNPDGSIAVGDATWTPTDSTVTRRQERTELLRVGTPMRLAVDGPELVVEAAGRVVRMTGPMLSGGDR